MKKASRCVCFLGALCAALLAVATCAFAQAEGDYDRLPPFDETQTARISRIEDIPRQLRRAIQPECRLEESVIREIPITLFRPASSPPLAVVPCSSIVGFSQVYMFNFDFRRQPTPMTFVVTDPAGGFTTSNAPGLVTWDAQVKTLTAVEGNDIICGPITRQTYLYKGKGRDPNSTTLIRAERGKSACKGGPAWRVIWEAQPWE